MHNRPMARPDHDLVIHPALTIPASEVEITFARSGGPGGQHVNKTETKAHLRWNLATSAVLDDETRKRLQEKLERRITTRGEIVVASDRYRDQRRNVDEAIKRLVEMIQEALKRERPRKATKPTRASKRRRLDEKRRRGETKRMRKPPSRDG